MEKSESFLNKLLILYGSQSDSHCYRVNLEVLYAVFFLISEGFLCGMMCGKSCNVVGSIVWFN